MPLLLAVALLSAPACAGAGSLDQRLAISLPDATLLGAILVCWYFASSLVTVASRTRAGGPGPSLSAVRWFAMVGLPALVVAVWAGAGSSTLPMLAFGAAWVGYAAARAARSLLSRPWPASGALQLALHLGFAAAASAAVVHGQATKDTTPRLVSLLARDDPSTVREVLPRVVERARHSPREVIAACEAAMAVGHDTRARLLLFALASTCGAESSTFLRAAAGRATFDSPGRTWDSPALLAWARCDGERAVDDLARGLELHREGAAATLAALAYTGTARGMELAKAGAGVLEESARSSRSPVEARRSALVLAALGTDPGALGRLPLFAARDWDERGQPQGLQAELFFPPPGAVP